jgi:hypothetical protein
VSITRMRRALALAGAAVLTVSLMAPAAAQTPAELEPAGPDLERLEDLRLGAPITAQNGVLPSTSKLVGGLLQASGTQQVVVRLTEPSLAEAAASGRGAPQAQAQQKQRIERQQARVAQRAQQLGARELARTENALAAVLLEADAGDLQALADLPEVERIAPVVDYELDLAQTVPYIGAAAVQAGDGVPGATGEGILVAVIDSGIDYTHAALGGPGTLGAFQRAYGPNANSAANRTITQRYNDPGFRGQRIFPTDKVVAGYDFTGEAWPDGALRPNPNPIDIEGHGTSVADIIAGEQGVAPDAKLVALKACASYAPNCSGVALIQSMDFALDPFQTGTIDNPVDIINMSLGANYGVAFDDDLSFAVDNASAIGVLTVSSAGNGSDRPFISGTPSSAPTALSVAQTAVPDERLLLWEVGGSTYQAVPQPWAPDLTEAITADTVYLGALEPGNALGCAPISSDLSGLIVVIDRGECNFTLKAVHATAAGAEVAIIGLVTAEDPFTGGDGGDRPIDIPTFMVSQAASNVVRGAAGPIPSTFDPEQGLPLVGTVVGSSSRGPSQDAVLLKPEIGAPGASVAAVAGSATGTSAFGGTSGASPMVAGSAALLMELHPDRSWAEIKALLMNTAETEIYNGAPGLGIGLAPISRIGGGEVRVDRAAGAEAAAWVDAATGEVGLAFGQVDVTDVSALTKTVTVANYASTDRTFSITPSFRFDADAALGAATPSAPGSISVPAGGTATFDLTLTIDGAALRDWNLNSGLLGGSGDALTAMELDGYVTLTAGDGEAVHVPWHVLPRKAGDVQVLDEVAGGVVLQNTGVATAALDAYSLIGTSEPSGEERVRGEGLFPLDLRAAGVQEIPVPTTVCDAEVAYIFGTSTYERQSHAVAPGVFEWQLDVTGDGAADFAVFDFDLGYPFLADGRSVTFALDLASGALSAFFFTGHSTQTGFRTHTICGEQIGIDSYEAAAGTLVGVDVLAVDIYYRGAVTDAIEDASFRVGTPRTPAIGGALPPGATAGFPVIDDGDQGTSESGILLHLGDAPADNEVLIIEFE